MSEIFESLRKMRIIVNRLCSKLNSTQLSRVKFQLPLKVVLSKDVPDGSAGNTIPLLRQTRKLTYKPIRFLRR